MKRIMLFLVFLSLTSCDWEHVYDYNIKNASQNDIMVTFSSCDVKNGSVIIKTDSIKTISTYVTFGNDIDHYKVPPSIYFDTISIFQDAISGQRVYKIDEYWTFSILSKTNAVYLLEIKQDDFK